MSERAEASGAAFWGDADETEALHRYQRLVNAVDHGIYQIDVDGHFVAVNDVIVELTGYAREELLGEHVSEVVCDASPIEREIERLIETPSEQSERFDLFIRTADGEHVSCEVGMNPLIEDDTLQGAVGTVRDLTEREQTRRESSDLPRERELRRYERIVENLPVGVYRNTPGPTGEFVEVNSTLAEIFDADSKDELLGYNVRDLHPDPDRRAEFSRQLEREGRVEDVELKQETIDGETIWISVTAVRTEEDGEVYFDGVVQDVTERKERERELQQYERILETIEDGVYALDGDSRFLMVNEAFASMLGVDRDSLIGEHVSVAFGDEAASLGDELQQEMIEGETDIAELEEHFMAEDGEIPVTTRFTLFEIDGEIGRAGVVRDESERKERERQLRDAKSQLEAATEAGAVGTWEWHIPEDRFVADPAFARTFDVDPDAAAEGVSLEQFTSAIHDDDIDRVEQRIEEALETCGEYEAEYRVRNADGEFRWVNARGEVKCDEDGNPVTFPGALTDITERKRTELELERNKDQLETLFEILPVGVVVADEDGRLVDANDTAKEIWGGDVFDADTVEDYEKYSAVWADSGEPVETDEWTMTRVLQGEQVTEPDILEIETDDGDRKIVRVDGMPVRDASGEVSRGVITLTDITERKEQQRKLEESNERLEQFAYAASHDLQEPLRMVSSYLQLLENRYADELDEEAEEFIDFAVDGAERMRDMIEGLLEYSRVDTRGNPFEAVDLDDVLADVRNDLQMTIEESDAEITAESLPSVVGDPGQLRQVFQNLLDNAIEYSGDDPPEVHVSAEKNAERRSAANAASEAAQNADEWVISVSDEGVGIDPDEADRVFEVFHRLHTSDEHSGTGIGLALCERIIDRHGGDIWVESESGEGATFSFTLSAAGDDDE